MSKKKFALRSIENVIDTVGKKAKTELPVDSRATSSLNNFRSTIDRVSDPESDSDSMYQFNEIHRMFEEPGVELERPKPALLKQKSSTISSASSILSGPRSKSKKVVRILDSESDDKENIKEKDIVAFSSAPSGSSILITRRQDNNIVPKPQEKRKVRETRSQKTAENVKQQSETKVQSPKGRIKKVLLLSSITIIISKNILFFKFSEEKSKPKISRGLGNIVESMNFDEKKKDFDYFLQKTINETSSSGSTTTKVTKVTTTASLAAPSIHSNDDENPTKATTPTQTGRVKRKSALKASEMLQNIDFEEDERIREKYDRRSKGRCLIIKFFFLNSHEYLIF